MILFLLVFFLLVRITKQREKFVIVTSHWNEDLKWLTSSKYPVVLIDHQGSAPSVIQPTTTIPNRGREASSYLRYILDNYDSLPEHIAFIHGHEHAWHHKNGPLLPLIESASLTDDMYFTLYGHYDHGSISLEKSFVRDWHVVEPWLGPLPKTPPCHDFAAQFIVSRNRIQSRPKKMYQVMYDYIVHPMTDHYGVGNFYEYIWHYIFKERWNECFSPAFPDAKKNSFPRIDDYRKLGF